MHISHPQIVQWFILPTPPSPAGLDMASPGSSAATAAGLATGEAGDDDVEEGGNGADDGREDTSNAVDNGHQACADSTLR